MTKREQLQDFYHSSEKMSTYTRNINYSLIAVIWILSHENTQGLSFYICPLLVVIASLVADYFQSMWQTITTYIVFKKSEKADPTGLRNNFTYPAYISKGAWFFFIAKVVFMVFSLVLLVICMFDSLPNKV